MRTNAMSVFGRMSHTVHLMFYPAALAGYYFVYAPHSAAKAELAKQEEWDNIWRNQAWPVNFTIRLNDGKTTLDQEKSETFWEEREDGVCLFSNRSEAMKFKRFLISSLSGGDDDFSKSFKDVKPPALFS